jgi:hypothetical protein
VINQSKINRSKVIKMNKIKLVKTNNGTNREIEFSVNSISQWTKFNDKALDGIATKYNITREDINSLITKYSESKPINKSESYSKLNQAIANVNAHNTTMLTCALINGIITGKIKSSKKIKETFERQVACMKVQSEARGMLVMITDLPERINKEGLLTAYWGNWVKQSGDDTGKEKRYYYNARVNPNAQDEALSVMLKDRPFLELYPQYAGTWDNAHKMYTESIYEIARPEIKTLVLMGGILTDDGKDTP